MKKIILLLIILTTKSFAQEVYFISFGLDPKLAIKGAYRYDETPVLDISFKTGTRLENGIEIGGGLEYAKLNPYYLSGNIFLNKVISNWKETILYSVGTEFLMIDRGRFNGSEKIDQVYTFGFNAETRIRIIDGFQIGLNLNLTHRDDLIKMYNEKLFFKTNGTIRFIYEWERY